MKRLSAFVFLLSTLLGFIQANVLVRSAFDSESSLRGWQCGPGGRIAVHPDGRRALQVTTPADYRGRDSFTVNYRLPLSSVAGRRLTVSVDIARDVMPNVKWQGAKLMLSYKSRGKWDWPCVYLKPGKFGWERRVLTVDLPLELDSATLQLGIQAGRGTVWYRNLTLDAGDVMVDLRQDANMGYYDPVANDGQGGWSDQGPYNDAGNFLYQTREFGGIPFSPIDPRHNGGKSVVVFKSSRFPSGPQQVTVDLSKSSVKASHLYLLHTLTWGAGFSKDVGYVHVKDVQGREQTIPVRGLTDVSDWWQPSTRKNAFPAALWQNKSNQTVGVYGTKFKLDPKLGKLASMTFAPSREAPIWILLGATLSEHDYPYPAKQSFVTKATKDWQVLPKPSKGGVYPGSALDLTPCFPFQPTGSRGRVIINENGHFAFAENPDQPVRFLATVVVTDPFGGRGKAKPEFTSKAMIEEYARQVRMQGYNLVRFHYLDAVLMSGSKEDYVFNAKYLDMFDYFVYCLKKNGVYIYLDCMASRIGWSHGYSWAAKPGDKRFFKLDIHFNPKVRENWEAGVRKVLTRVNPYTKTRLVDDPVLVMAVSYNEQEFAFFHGRDFAQATEPYRAFLKKRYGTLQKLKKAWGDVAKSYGDFSDIPVYTVAQLNENSQRGKDVGLFIAETETATGKWYRDTLRKIGYKGYLMNYNMGQNLRYVVVRSQDQMVGLNGYHAHPFNNAMETGGSINQTARVMRGFFSVRPYKKPLVITEHGHMFWNSYRYEQGFVDGGYAAFQNLDGLSGFANQITVRTDVNPIMPCQMGRDIIIKAGELQTAFLFRRGDLTPASTGVRVQVDPKAIFTTGTQGEALHSMQAHLALVTGFSVEPSTTAKPQAHEMFLDAAGGSSLVIKEQHNAGYMQAQDAKDASFDFSQTLAKMKRLGLVPADNRTNAKAGIFETANGEIYMDSPRHFMRINTPRFQGICAEAGTTAALKDFQVLDLTERGTLSAISLNNDKSLADAERILIVYATNALNSGMVFADELHRTRLQNGDGPILLKTGSFKVRLKNRHAQDFKLYALAQDGRRIAELPLTVQDDALTIQVNTAKIPHGPAVFFELARP